MALRVRRMIHRLKPMSKAAGTGKSASLLRIVTRALLLALALGAVTVSIRGLAAAQGNAATHTDAERQFSHAQELLLQGDVAGALTTVREGLASDPRSVEGLNLLGMIYDQQKEYSLAERALEQALKIEPGSTKTHNNLGNSYVLGGKLGLAEREFRASLRLDPHDHDAAYNLGLVRLAQGDAQGAVTILSRVEPRDPGTSFNLMRAYFAAHATSKGLELARSLSGQSPKDPRLHLSLGAVLAAAKQYAPAVREFELADALAPGTFEILFNLGQAYRHEGDLPKADDALSRALKLRPDSVGALYMLAQVKSDERKYLDALDLLLDARKLDPKNTDVLFLMGRISMIENYFEDAIPVLEDGVKIDPRRADLHAALGESYFTVGKVDRAVEEFKTLVSLDPSAGSYAFMGLAYRHLGRFDEAKHYFELGLTHDPRNATCLFNLGYIANRQGNYSEAAQFLSEALKSGPDAGALYELATVKMAQKSYAEAIPLLEQCSKMMSRPAEAYYKLATAERNLHRMEAAERDMKVFETLAKEQPGGPMPFQHLFDALNRRLNLPRQARAELDVEDLKQQVAKRPDDPRSLYLLAEAYLKTGDLEHARAAVSEIDRASGGDYRTALGVGTLLAQHGLLPEAVRHFQAALTANPGSDDAKYDLADAYFQMRDYAGALEVIQQVSPGAQNDDAYLALAGDIFAHAGRTADAVRVLEEAVRRNPDNDQDALSLALAQMQTGTAAAAEKTLRQGLAHTPDSGRLYWGLGIVSVIEGRNREAESYLARAIDLLPDWPAGYSALGTFYYETGQISKARETLGRYQQLFPHGALDVSRIQATLAHARDASTVPPSLPAEARLRFLGIAAALEDHSP